MSMPLFARFLALAMISGAFSCLKPAEKNAQIPNDYLWMQRAFPYQHVPTEAYYQALHTTRQMTAARGGVSLHWQSVGPTKISGRITDVAMHPDDQQTIYAASASGGVWKSLNAGLTWFPISDQLPSLSIGDIAIAPSDRNLLYCGTGETNGGGGSVTYDGQGLFRSTDGGNTWAAAGLADCGSIGRIEVDPHQPERVWVAAMGHLFGNNPDRGVFRSIDGGNTWEKTLFINDSTGVIDLAVHPQHPDTLFAVSWERIRRPNKRVYGGPGSALWRSYDGGDTWKKLTNGLPTGVNVGRMGIAFSASHPNRLYLTAANRNGAFVGVYHTQNLGDNWALVPQNADPGYSSFGWWFGQIRVHPINPDQVYNMGIGWLKTDDAGANWAEVSPYLHADYHALYIHPANPSFQVAGNDGGIYISTNAGVTWQHRPFPITQFYTCEIDYQMPHRYAGGAQDNGTLASYDNGPNNWQRIYGGDGFVTLVNPLDNSIYYAESQYGGFSGSNGASAPAASRYNWNTPYIFDPNDPNIMYFGAERLFKSTNGGLNWTPISADLSNGPTGSGGVVYGTITTIAASPLDGDALIAGTDDGNVWITTNGGAQWNKASTGLPRRWVTRVVADRFDPQTFYVCFSGFRHHENIAHLYKTTDNGQTWTDVSGNLPDVPVNDWILDPLDPSVWYIATDAGVFTTADAGAHWAPANDQLPLVPVLDLTFHAPTRTLLAATYGRSVYVAEAPLPSRTTDRPGLSAVVLQPNPAVETCRISFSTPSPQMLAYTCFTADGKIIAAAQAAHFSAGKHQLTIQVAHWPPGVYFCRLQTADGASVVKKLLKS